MQKVENNAFLGLTINEIQNFSLLKAVNALANPHDRAAQEAAGLEKECSLAVGQTLKKTPQGFFLPMDVMAAKQDYSTVRADLLRGTGSAGGFTVATSITSFIELLRNSMMVRQLGATILDGLVGDVAIPRLDGTTTAYWVAENSAPTESQPTFGQVTMTPKTVGGFTDLSRKLLLQSSLQIEQLVRQDLATVIAQAIDQAAINGTGASNQPTGILATSGIGDVAGGANGLAPTRSHLLSLWTALANMNAAVGPTGFLTNSKVVGKLMTTPRMASTDSKMVLDAFPNSVGIADFDGAPLGMSNNVPANLSKGTSSGVCSAIICGNWVDLLIGQWGALDVLVDPYTGGTSGTVRVRVLQDVDVALRHAASFAAMQDALTT